MIPVIEDAKPDIVCISALPPFAISHARNLYLRLRAHSPELKIVTGLWEFSGDLAKIAGRLRLSEGDQVFVHLNQVTANINGVAEIQSTRSKENLDSMIIAARVSGERRREAERP